MVVKTCNKSKRIGALNKDSNEAIPYNILLRLQYGSIQRLMDGILYRYHKIFQMR